ncbi:hypothetical protein ALC62_00900 [Cyphomyrmex costatus]|uniref:Uncharacterized protein n=1 Tax=Cyphomyrmex costatus TaxID=456900 RepID=A0A195D576_9HYME|nr:hypothetical protein ALC62_00900 [Cyphomyrmex costatus]
MECGPAVLSWFIDGSSSLLNLVVATLINDAAYR